MSYLLEKTLVLSIICRKCKNEDEELFTEEVELKIYNYSKKMVEENLCLEFRLKNIDEITNYLIEERNLNELMSKKHIKVCATLI